MVEIRNATPADTETWLELRVALWPEETREAHLQEINRFFAGRPKEPEEVFLAEDSDGNIVGFVELAIRPFAEGCNSTQVAYLEGWYVESNSRRQGIGRALVEASEEWGRSHGCTEFASDAYVSNVISQASHLALGFKETGLVRCFKKDI